MTLAVSKMNAGLLQYSLIGGHPSKPEPRHNACNIIGNRTFRRPQPMRVFAEPLMYKLARSAELFFRIFGKAKSDWHITIADLTVDQQREKRVIERRCRNFDRPLVLSAAI